MANTPAECQQMIEAARKAGRKLMVAYRCRYEPYNQKAVRIARSHELGPTKVILADNEWRIGDPLQVETEQEYRGRGFVDGHRHLRPARGPLFVQGGA